MSTTYAHAGQTVRVIAIQSRRRGETGVVVDVSPRGILTVDMAAGDRAQWPSFELALMSDAEPTLADMRPYPNTRELSRAMRQLTDERGEGWARDMSRVAFNTELHTQILQNRNNRKAGK